MRYIGCYFQKDIPPKEVNIKLFQTAIGWKLQVLL